MELLLIYIWLKLDTIRFFSGMIAGCTGFVFLFWAFVNWAENFNKPVGKLMYIPVVLGSFALFLPSSKDVAILTGSYIGLEAAKSPEAHKVWTVIRGKANQILDEQIKELNK